VEGYRPRKGIGADVPEPRPRPGIGGILPPPWAPVRTGPDCSVFPKGHGASRMPTWLEFDKKVYSLYECAQNSEILFTIYLKKKN
jgi:hypothetical protein